MIQLISVNNKIIYELEKSELFPDYRSVLKEAIALNIDLKGLLVESKFIDNIVWKGTNMNGITFKNCSMKRNEFLECFGNGSSFDTCDLTSLKVKNSNLDGLYISNSNLSLLSFRNSSSYNSSIIDCDCTNSSFYGSNGYFGRTVPRFSVKQCHFERCCNNTK